jgi:hypothetical protein
MLNNFSKHDRRLLFVALLLLCVFSFLLYDDSLLMDLIVGHGRQIADISRTDNDVRQKYATDFRWIPVNKAIVHENDSVFTGADSEATIVLADGSEVHLKENTLVTFRTVNGQLTLGLKYGNVETKSEKLKIVSEAPKQLARKPASPIVPLPKVVSPEPGEKKLVPLDLYGKKTASSEININWTYDKSDVQFQVQVAKDKEFQSIELDEKLMATELKTPEMEEGFHFIRVREWLDDKNFGKWSKISKIDMHFVRPDALPTPKLLTKEFKLRIEDKKHPKIQWSKVAGALVYEMQFSESPEFKTFETFQGEHHTFLYKAMQPGFHYFRVIAHGNMGLQSLPSETGLISITTDAPILEPVKIKKYIPKDERDVLPTPTTFGLKWSESNHSDAYLVQISKAPDFSEPMEFQSKSRESIVNIEKTGKYHWRVRSLASTGKPVSEFSKPGEFIYSMEKPLSPPRLIEPMDGMTLFFQKKNDTPFYLVWGKVENAILYTLELATDAQFKSVIMTSQVPSNKQLIRENLPRGELYWRVRAEAPQRLSHWSEARKMSIFAGRNARGQ